MYPAIADAATAGIHSMHASTGMVRLRCIEDNYFTEGEPCHLKDLNDRIKKIRMTHFQSLYSKEKLLIVLEGYQLLEQKHLLLLVLLFWTGI